MTTVLFSMPCHESHEAVNVNISNLRRFNGLQHPIVIHADSGWNEFDPERVDFSDIYVNPTRYRTQHAHSQIATHISNYLTAVERGVEFDYVAVYHTSEMFVKRGMHDHIARYDYSLWFTPENQPKDFGWPPLRNAIEMNLFKDLFPANDVDSYLGNLLEGSWWSRDLFKEIVDWTLYYYDLEDLRLPWAVEECFFPTLSWHLSGGKRFTHPYCAFHHKDHYIQDRTLIDNIRAGRDITCWQPQNFVYDWKPIPSEGFYSVKRVSRDLEDPIRHYISWLKT